ncbi:hypothetical protein ACQP06_21060 [Nocardia sp. CA-136227]|uniref:hypothetical protein n=1 Tax=Nocardia sp. CA-136227 TaxID=3239979 RepID=UPI003D96D067
MIPVGSRPPAEGQAMIDKLIAPALRTPKLVLALIAIAFVVCGAIGTQAAARLSNGGFVSTHSESAQVGRILERDYGLSGMQLVLTVESPGGAHDPATAARGKDIAQRLKGDSRISKAVSPWTEPTLSTALLSTDGRIGLIVANVRGDENVSPGAARDLADEFTGTHDGVSNAGPGAGAGRADGRHPGAHGAGPGVHAGHGHRELVGPAPVAAAAGTGRAAGMSADAIVQT